MVQRLTDMVSTVRHKDQVKKVTNLDPVFNDLPDCVKTIITKPSEQWEGNDITSLFQLDDLDIEGFPIFDDDKIEEALSEAPENIEEHFIQDENHDAQEPPRENESSQPDNSQGHNDNNNTATNSTDNTTNNTQNEEVHHPQTDTNNERMTNNNNTNYIDSIPNPTNDVIQDQVELDDPPTPNTTKANPSTSDSNTDDITESTNHTDTIQVINDKPIQPTTSNPY